MFAGLTVMEAAHFFEGTEKLLEVWFSRQHPDAGQGSGDLRTIPRWGAARRAGAGPGARAGERPRRACCRRRRPGATAGRRAPPRSRGRPGPAGVAGGPSEARVGPGGRCGGRAGAPHQNPSGAARERRPAPPRASSPLTLGRGACDGAARRLQLLGPRSRAAGAAGAWAEAGGAATRGRARAGRGVTGLISKPVRHVKCRAGPQDCQARPAAVGTRILGCSVSHRTGKPVFPRISQAGVSRVRWRASGETTDRIVRPELLSRGGRRKGVAAFCSGYSNALKLYL